MVLCCICGVQLDSGGHGGRCVQCLQSEVDITEGISRRAHITQCRTCGRFVRPGGSNAHMVSAEFESRELLGICLKSIKGISKEHQVVDATFLWTEPHSKELRVKLVVQKEAMSGVVLQQTLTVEIRIENLQCKPCQKSFTKHTWESNVQLRQRTDHRRTLLNLEQLILQHKAHTQLIKVEQSKDGLDFFFRSERDAQAFVQFVKGVAVIKHQSSKHLVSHNAQNSSYRYKRTTLVELCPVCRDDFVFLPPKLAQSLGGLPRYLLCTKAATFLNLLDPSSGRSLDISAVEYWKKPFSAAFAQKQLTEFVVLDVTPVDFDIAPSRGRKDAQYCDVEIARVADFGQNEERIVVRSHLGHVLQPSDHALGYDLRTLNTGLDEEEMLRLPMEVYLVRKQRPEKKNHNNRKKTGGASKKGKKPKEHEIADAPPHDADQTENPTALTEELAGIGDNEDGEAFSEEDENEDAELRAAAQKMLSTLGSVDTEDQEAEPDPTQVELGTTDAILVTDVPENSAELAEPSFQDSDQEPSTIGKASRTRKKQGRAGASFAAYPDVGDESGTLAKQPDERARAKGGRGYKKK